ncbi:MAG: Gfo/Idh/MocA family oxidoreductase, partial [Clostridia bacterium]
FKKYADTYGDTMLAACCDVDENRAENYKNQFGFLKVYTDYVKMLDEERPDAVSIIVPVHLTEKITTDILKRGYPIITEKPPGINAEETKLIAEASRSADKLAVVAFNRRYAPAIHKAKKVICENFKDISSIYYTMQRCRRIFEDFSTTAIHAIDAVRYMAGCDYKTVDISYVPVYGFENEFPNVYLTCEMKSGARVRIDFSVSGGALQESFIVNGTDNTIVAHIPVDTDKSGSFKYYSYKGDSQESAKPVINDTFDEDMPFFIGQGFYGENEYFLNLIKKDSSSANSDILSGLQAEEIADAIRLRKKFIHFE